MMGILIIVLLWVLFKTKNNIIKAVIIAFFILWQGVPAFNIWRADKLVDELCAKDGGIKIYETVTLPKERFNEYGQFVIPPDKRYLKPNDEYFMQIITETVIGNNDYVSLLPRVRKDHVSIIGVKDNRKLAEYISYGQRNGEAMGFSLTQAGYSCPKVSDLDLIAKVFIKENK
jgi:hypothetical protein